MALGDQLAALNALLNSISFVLLTLGLVQVRRGNHLAHKRAMVAAFAVSALFLCSYLTRIAVSGTHSYPADGGFRTLYLGVLVVHVILAALVPFFAVAGIWLGVKDRRATHKKVMRVGLPIWMVVSVTGVMVYLMLYSAMGRLPF